MKLAAILFTCFLLSGCGLMEASRDSASVKKSRSMHLDPHHIFSCGPKAIHKAFLQFNIHISAQDISHAIQSNTSCSNLLRDFLSALDNDARKITFPSELKRILKKNGFTIVNIKSLKDLNQSEDIALVLIKDRKSLNYHWMCFPVDKNIQTFFGKDTIIKEIYLIKK